MYNQKHLIIFQKWEKCNRKVRKTMPDIPESVKLVLERLEAAGHEAWCVGGCVLVSIFVRSEG